MGNAVVAQLDATRAPFTSAGILTSIEQCSELCDQLARDWDADHRDLDSASFRKLCAYNAWANARAALLRERSREAWRHRVEHHL